MTAIFLVFFVYGLLGAVMVIVNKILGPKRPTPAKNKPFECGSPYLQEGINPVPVKYYVVAFLFLLFDVEVVFFFPWALVFKELGTTAVVFMSVYVFLLAVGFIYAWRKGAFQWEK